MSEQESTFQRLLNDAVTKEGSIMKAYHAFHGYSFGNQLLAYFQCASREIEIGPINTYKGWQALGRQVQSGQNAIMLCMPVTKKGKVVKDEKTGEDKQSVSKFFVYKNRWFVLSQTKGDDFKIPELPEFNAETALNVLEVERVPFAMADGNVQGYAKDRQVAINPVAQLPLKTLFHELGHVLLGHTAEGEVSDTDRTPKNLREVEAEAVALLCCEALGLEGPEFSRGYIQSYWKDGQEIPETSCKKIITVAGKILKAGQGDVPLTDDDKESIRAAKTDEVNY